MGSTSEIRSLLETFGSEAGAIYLYHNHPSMALLSGNGLFHPFYDLFTAFPSIVDLPALVYIQYLARETLGQEGLRIGAGIVSSLGVTTFFVDQGAFENCRSDSCLSVYSAYDATLGGLQEFLFDASQRDAIADTDEIDLGSYAVHFLDTAQDVSVEIEGVSHRMGEFIQLTFEPFSQ